MRTFQLAVIVSWLARVFSLTGWSLNVSCRGFTWLAGVFLADDCVFLDGLNSLWLAAVSFWLAGVSSWLAGFSYWLVGVFFRLDEVSFWLAGL